jgi:hypothetical protein
MNTHSAPQSPQQAGGFFNHDMRPHSWVIIWAVLVILSQGCTWDNPALIEIGRLITPVGTYAVGTNPTSIAAGDFNTDGLTDLLVTNVSGDSLSLLLGKGDGTFQDTTTLKTGNMPRALVAADFSGDGHMDIALANAGSEEVTILIGKGDGTFQPGESYSTHRAPLAIIISDFNRDHKDDLAVALKSDAVEILWGNGNGTFKKGQTLEVEDTPTSVAAADLNQDGIIDLAIANNGAMSNNISVFMGQKDGTFKSLGHFPTGMRPLFVTTGDFTGDGRLDLEVVNGVRDSLSLLPGNGDGTFKAAINFGAGTGPASSIVLDINGDGILDTVVVNNLGSTMTLLIGKGDGTFYNPPINYLTETGPFTIIQFEFKRGGKKGLAIANNAKNSISIFAINPPPSTPARIPAL